MRRCVLAWGLGALLAAGARAQELPLRESSRGWLFGTERFAVRLDPQTGWAGEVLCDGQPIVEAAGTRQVFDVRQGDAWVTGDGSKIQGAGVERIGPDTVKSRMRVGEWSVDACIRLFPEQRMLRRWFELTWKGDSATTIKAFWIQGGVLRLSEGGGYFCPAQYPPKRVAGNELVAGRKTNTGRSPCLLIGDTGWGWSALWMSDELVDYADRGGAVAAEEPGLIRVTQSFNTLGHMRKGVTQKVGDAWLWVQPNDAETALRRMGEWFRHVNQVPPEGRPEWLKRVVLYSFHPGGTIGSTCKDLGGFKAATGFLPHIRALGCNAIWLMPLEDKSIYWPRDYYAFQEGLGTAEDYKALTAKARGLGLRVWQDCVPHGGCNEFPRAKEHPEWLAQNEDGSTLHYWCFDFNWPTWIEYMSNVVSFYTREYGLDGFRIDACGGSKIPNWNPAIPYARASHAQAQGGLAMQRALRKAVRAVRPDGANLAEVGASIHGAVSDSTYDFDLCYSVLHDFRRSGAAEFVPRLSRWLHEQSCAEVPDLVRMRHVESHDSLRSGLWYGADAQRALVALISWIHGIPMVYHEMEDGHYDLYRRIFHVRSHVAELNAGAADYLSASAPEGVFACLRTGALPAKDSAAWHADYAWDTAPKNPERASLVLVNLNGTPVKGEVAVPVAALPEALRGADAACDAMTGEMVKVRDGRMEVSLAPFGYTVLRFAGRALPELEALPQAVPRTRSDGHRGGAEIKLKADSGTLVIDAKTGLATAWKSGWRTVPVNMDLALPEELARVGAAVPAVIQTGEGGVEVSYEFGARTLNLAYAVAGGRVSVRADWRGGVPQDAALLVSLPAAESWFACTAEGAFESPFRVRHPGFDGAVGSIYRLPQGTSTLWDSRLHPFGLDPAHAQVGALCGGRRVSFGFEPASPPASVQVLDRVGDDHGMKVLISWREALHGVQAGGEGLAFSIGPEMRSSPGTGDARLTAVGGGWLFENGHYRAQVGRNGVLSGLWRKEGSAWRLVARRSQLYTDKGFEGDKKMAQEDDVETSVRFSREGASLKMEFCGELRGFCRFDKMAHPIRFHSAYTFDDREAFRQTSAFNASSPASGPYAFLSLLTHTEGAGRVAYADASGEILAGALGDGRERQFQTAKAQGPKRVPREILLGDASGTTLRLGDLDWFGSAPANLFTHGKDLHIAWMDGAPDNSGAGRWNGVSMSVSCGGDVTARAGVWPVARESQSGLLRDGDFERGGGGGLMLLVSRGRVSGGMREERGAWQLPEGAGIVREGGGRCASVEGDGQSYRLLRQHLPAAAFAEGSVWRLTARVKAAGVEKGDAGWKTACVRWAVGTGERFVYATVSLPAGDCDWREVGVEVEVPKGVTAVSVEAGLNGNKGRMWIDDVRIGPAAK